MAKKKEILKSCGFCHVCGKEHLSNEGGWVINAEKLNFCYEGDGNCYDQYLANVRSERRQSTSTNPDYEKRMNMYIEYLKTKKCQHKYSTEN